MKKPKRTYDKTSRDMKKAGITNGVVVRTAAWQESRRDKTVPGKPKVRPKGEKPLQLSTETKLAMARDKAGGMTTAALADKYSVSESYIEHSLRTLFTQNAVGREILKGVLLDNAIASGMHVRANIGELQPMQAVIATGVMTQRFIDLDKHTQKQAPEIDTTTLSQVGEILKDIKESLGNPDDQDVLDI